MEAHIRPYLDSGAVETVIANLEGAKCTLAANPHGASQWRQGVTRRGGNATGMPSNAIKRP